MKKVRAKFKCDAVTRRESAVSIECQPVYSSDPESENKAFWEASPSGKLELYVTNEDAFDSLPEPGEEFYVDLVPLS